MSKSSSKKVRKDGSVKKVTQKPVPVRKATPAKRVKSPAKSPKLSTSAVKRGANDADGSLSKSKGSTSKKQKVEKESTKNIKEKDTRKKHPSKSPAKVSTKDQGVLPPANLNVNFCSIIFSFPFYPKELLL